jgi:hypothetical protein
MEGVGMFEGVEQSGEGVRVIGEIGVLFPAKLSDQKS